MDDLTKAVSEALKKIIDSGGKAPFYITIVGTNGAMQYHRFYNNGFGGYSADMLASHAGDLQMPVNMMIVDSRGEAYRVLFTAEGVQLYLH